MKTFLRLAANLGTANLIFLTAIGGCGQTSPKNSDNTDNSSNCSGGRGQGSGNFPGGGGVGQGGGGFSVSLAFADGTKTDDLQTSIGGFRVACARQDAVVTKLELKLTHTKAADGSVEETSAKFASKCIGAATISVPGLATGDKAVLTVNEIDTGGATKLTGATAEYTQADTTSTAAPTTDPATGRRVRAPLPSVDIKMAAPSGAGAGSGSGSALGSASGSGS